MEQHFQYVSQEEQYQKICTFLHPSLLNIVEKPQIHNTAAQECL